MYFCFRRKIEALGKMTQMSQEEILQGTRAVLQGLEALRCEHAAALAAAAAAATAEGAIEEGGDRERDRIVRKSIEAIELGLGEAQVEIITFCALRCNKQNSFKHILHVINTGHDGPCITFASSRSRKTKIAHTST